MRQAHLVQAEVGMILLVFGWGWGTGPSVHSPMAIAVTGGPIASTRLNLLVVPAVFTYIDDLEHWLSAAWLGCGAWLRP